MRNTWGDGSMRRREKSVSFTQEECTFAIYVKNAIQYQEHVVFFKKGVKPLTMFMMNDQWPLTDLSPSSK